MTGRKGGWHLIINTGHPMSWGCVNCPSFPGRNQEPRMTTGREEAEELGSAGGQEMTVSRRCLGRVDGQSAWSRALCSAQAGKRLTKFFTAGLLGTLKMLMCIVNLSQNPV